MKTILIVETSLDGLRLTRDKLVKAFSDNGNLKKYGDDSVETNDDKVYFIKVLSINDYRTKFMTMVGRGYDDIRINAVSDEISKLLAEISKFSSEHTKPSPVSPAQSVDERDQSDGNPHVALSNK